MDWFHCDVQDGYAIYTNNQEGISVWGAANIYGRHPKSKQDLLDCFFSLEVCGLKKEDDNQKRMSMKFFFKKTKCHISV